MPVRFPQSALWLARLFVTFFQVPWGMGPPLELPLGPPLEPPLESPPELLLALPLELPSPGPASPLLSLEIGMTQPMTSDNDEEIQRLLKSVKEASPLGLIHESVNVDRTKDFMRSWFAWANSVFAQTILDLAERKPHLLFGEGVGAYII